jgi:hypothetical protein
MTDAPFPGRNTVGAAPGDRPGAGTLGPCHYLGIGIDGYEKWGRLQTAVAGARALGDLLQAEFGFAPENCRLLCDAEATRDRIVGTLRRLARQLPADASLLIYFAGHGHLDDLTKKGFWVPVEGLPPAGEDDDQRDAATWIANTDLKDLLENFPARHVLLISDSCYAGDLLKTREAPAAATGDYVRAALARTSRQVLTSGGLHPVADNGFDGHSVFTYFLLKALREERGAWLLPDEPHRRVRDGVMANARQQPLCGTLPGTRAELGGEFVLLRHDWERQAATAAEARAASAQGEAAALAGAAAAAETRLQQLLTAEATAQREDAVAALARKAEAERQEKEAAASATAHRERMAGLAVQIREIEGRLGRSETAVNDGAGVLEQLTALLDEQERLAGERQRLEAEAVAERQRREEQERKEAAQRERERQAREAEMARLAEAERARTVAERKATFEKGYAAYQRIAQSTLPAEAKRSAWLDLCRRVGLMDQPKPVPLAWNDDQVLASCSKRLTDYSTIQPFTNSLGMKFVPVVTSADGKEAVLLSVWATRVGDYAEYAASNPDTNDEWKRPGFAQQDTHPVVQVSWEDAQGFCAWLTATERAAGRIAAHWSYRLPTDAEWSWAVGIGAEEEWAGRHRSPQEKDQKIGAGSHPWAYPWGLDWPPPKGAGNYASSLQVDDYEKTSPVGSFGANAQGLYDLGGNVWEWVEDYNDGKDGSRALRGGSWGGGVPVRLLSSCRGVGVASFRGGHFGFRVVLSGSSIE